MTTTPTHTSPQPQWSTSPRPRHVPGDDAACVGDVRAGRAWAYAGAGLGALVSVAANIAHSFVPPAGQPAGWRPQPGAIALAAFWPCALLLAVEVLARVSWPAGTRWTLLRFGGVGPVAVVAAVVSYRHLSGLLGFYGEEALTVAIGPAAVDGLMVVATSTLLATPAARRLRTVQLADAPTAGSPAPVPTPTPTSDVVCVPDTSGAPRAPARPGSARRRSVRRPARRPRQTVAPR